MIAMVNIDGSKFRGGFWLGLVLVLASVSVLEVVRLVPASSRLQMAQLRASVSDAFNKNPNNNQTVASADPEIINAKKVHLVVGKRAAAANVSQNWRWARGANDLYEFKIPNKWHVQYYSTDHLALLDEQDKDTGIEIVSGTGSVPELNQKLFERTGVEPVSVKLPGGPGLMAKNKNIELIGFYSHRRMIICSTVDTDKDDLFAVVVSSLSWL